MKDNFGHLFKFWGAIDQQDLLPNGTDDELENDIVEKISILGEGGGYVLGAVHNVQPDVSVENLLAMYRHAVRYEPSFSR